MSRMRLFVALASVAAGAACVLFCCRIWLRGEDGWYCPPPPGFVPEDRGRAQVFARVVDHLDKAEKMLEVNSIVPLAEADVGYFGVEAKQAAPGLLPFLVRGLVGFEGTGKFFVYQDGDTLVVEHASLGSSRPRAKRRPVIVWLPEKPSKVFVCFSVDR